MSPNIGRNDNYLQKIIITIISTIHSPSQIPRAVNKPIIITKLAHNKRETNLSILSKSKVKGKRSLPVLTQDPEQQARCSGSLILF